MELPIINVGLILFLSAASFLLMIPTFGYALVICVDKYNTTSIIPCTDQNAIANSNMNSTNVTSSQGSNMTNTTTTENTTTSPGNSNQGISNTQPPSTSQSRSTPTQANIQLLFYRINHTSGYIFNTHWVVWGKVANTGGTTSNPISVQISCSNLDGAPLYSTTTSLTPSTLGPGETGTFSQPISSDDLQGTKYDFTYTPHPQVVGQ